MTTDTPPLFESAGCICIYEDKLLLLWRAHDRSYPNTWGLPSGKVEPGESSDLTIIREIYEETGLIRTGANLEYIDTLLIKNPEFEFLYSVFATRFGHQPAVHLNPKEHVGFRWVSLAEARELDLVPGTHQCLETARSHLFGDLQLTLFDVDDHVLSESAYEGTVDDWVTSLTSRSEESDLAPRLVVIGPPGVGKSTLVKGISRRTGLEYQHYEIMKDRTSRQYFYLREFLSGDRTYAFLCQIEALASRYWQAKAIGPNATIVDEWIFSTLAYSRTLRAQGSLEDREFQTFYLTYLAYAKLLPTPPLVMHLTADPEVLRTRIVRRRRKLEQISHNYIYLALLVKSFTEVAKEIAVKTRVFTIDTSGLSRAEVLERAVSLLEGL